MNKHKIIIACRTWSYIDYIAYIEEEPYIYGVGCTNVAAVGDLIMSHQDYFNTNINNK